jgi:tetratricopeptide (TPR) repeat protein
MAKKSKDTASDNGGDPNARYAATRECQAKARKWFERARELGDKRQYDYAIEYYVNGLDFWPDAVEEALKPLHGCGVARHQGGGSKPGFKDTMKRSMNDKDAKQAFLNSLWLFGHDPDNLSYTEGIVKSACRLRADDAAKWAGSIHLRALESTSKSGPKQFQLLARLMEELGDRAAARGEHDFALAALQVGIDAFKLWQHRKPKDRDLENLLRDLTTKQTILRGKYQDSDSFRDSIQDLEKAEDLHDLDRSVQSEDRFDELIDKARQAHEAAPEDPEAIKNYVDTLTRMEHDEDETVAIGVLVTAYKADGSYRWKQRADDIRMKQLNRTARSLAKAKDEEALKAHAQKKLKFELAVYKERTERYPTDLRVRFEYGVRLFKAGRFDEAIPVLQGARTDPKNRAACGLFLGRCFFRKGYASEATATLKETIESYEFEDDELAKSLAYWLGRSCEAGGDVDEARKTYGKLLQLDYTYRDVRARLDNLPSEP